MTFPHAGPAEVESEHDADPPRLRPRLRGLRVGVAQAIARYPPHPPARDHESEQRYSDDKLPPFGKADNRDDYEDEK